MISSLVRALISAFKARRELALENVALRQQLAVLRRSVKRPRLSKVDRGFWVLLRRIWTDWESVLVIVKPETVIRWHRCGFRRYWTWKSRRRRPGRPGVAPEIRELIRNMSRANPLWGAPRVHGELAKLGISISQAAVSKYRVRHRMPPSHTWRSFLDNHVKEQGSLRPHMYSTLFALLYVTGLTFSFLCFLFIHPCAPNLISLRLPGPCRHDFVVCSCSRLCLQGSSRASSRESRSSAAARRAPPFGETAAALER